MSDAAFKGAKYPGYTTAELQLKLIRHKEGSVTFPRVQRDAIEAEIARRILVAAGVTSVMTDGERLREVGKSEQA